MPSEHRPQESQAAALRRPVAEPPNGGRWGPYDLGVDILDLISLSGRLLPRLTRLAVIVVLLWFPTVAIAVVVQVGREEGARFSTAVHAILQRELKQARVESEAAARAREHRAAVKR